MLLIAQIISPDFTLFAKEIAQIAVKLAVVLWLVLFPCRICCSVLRGGVCLVDIRSSYLLATLLHAGKVPFPEPHPARFARVDPFGMRGSLPETPSGALEASKLAWAPSCRLSKLSLRWGPSAHVGPCGPAWLRQGPPSPTPVSANRSSKLDLIARQVLVRSVIPWGLRPFAPLPAISVPHRPSSRRFAPQLRSIRHVMAGSGAPGRSPAWPFGPRLCFAKRTDRPESQVLR